jgi:uncharacterized protein Yka (UPF0111/DUF47 family)
MAGVNRTAPLKFDHPGLGATATCCGETLVIQNDIGTTDAHVLIVHVEPPRVRVTHTDVHIQRLAFFQGMLERFGVTWDDTRSRRAAETREGLYHMCAGTYTAPTPADLEAYLTFLGSRLVFLIDWNRARKRLRKFAPRRVCLEVLGWAAEREFGHMGFLKLGGEQLLFDALALAARGPLQVGQQLADLLGKEKVTAFLKFTLQTASEGLRAGRSEPLIRDEISAELRHFLETAHQGLLEIAAEHASLIVELATAARDMLSPAAAPEFRRRVARQAKKWEHRADELVSKGRTARVRSEDARAILELLQGADDAADELEEAVFLLSLMPADETANSPFAPLQELAGLLVQGAQEYLKAVENARSVHRASPREQLEDFLEAVDRTVAIEHRTDDCHRQAQAGIIGFAGDFKQLHLFTLLADSLEEAADALMRSAHLLRDYVLGEVLTR